MKINVYNQQKALSICKKSVKDALKELCSYLKVETQEISIYFVTEKKICSLHQEFFNDPTPTDCMSFPIDASHLGEIVICPSVAMNYDFNHPCRETLLYLVHGLLHLLGYDDIDPKQRRTMRKMEKRCMDHLNALNIQITK